jgi:GNAT superfamily N-acetyltransferase
MGYADLRDRGGDDPEVRRLLGQTWAPGEPAPLLGWCEDGELVGLVAIERPADREVRLVNVFVREGSRQRGIGRVLIDALVAGAMAERFVARCERDAVGFFERCGFTAVPADDARSFDCVRLFSPRPAAPEAVYALTLTDLEAAIRASWSSETSTDPGEWSPENPSRGQCDVTAMLVRSYLGGEILVANVLREGRRVERHAWNRLPSGLTIDLTREQFKRAELLDEPLAQEPLGLGNARERQSLLARRVEKALRAPHSAAVRELKA